MKKEDGTWTLWDGNKVLDSKLNVVDGSLGLDHYKCIVAEDGSSVHVVRFADLHRHSDNSLKDGMITVPNMIAHTEYAGAITDHGNMYGFLEFYKGMKAAGKHPIIGFEAYQEDLLGNLTRNHLILLAKNNQGYQNLLKLTSESFSHFYHVPHVTWDMLERYHEGVICTSACIGGLIPQAIIKQEYDLTVDATDSLAEVALRRYLSLFGEDFYIEIQRHELKEESLVNPALIELARKYNVPVIAATDAHYVKKDDSFAHEVLLCLQTKKTIDEPHFQFKGTGYHMHSSEEMEALFADIPEALDNTLLLAEKCDVNISLGEVNLPDYDIPPEFATPFAYFQHLCELGFQARFEGTSHLTDQVYLDRFRYELEVIQNMHFESYFIIVQDFINFARKEDIYVGPGRGSAAGSLLAYCMGITDMDPIRFKLLFERFLNPERVSWPDVDVDLAHTGRQRVIDYMTKKYGAESTCRIVTFGTMAAKMSIKDVGRVLGYSPGWTNALAKLVPNDPKMTLTKAFSMNPELRSRYDSDSDVAKVIDVARVLEGNKRHSSLHACGLVISPGMVDSFLPISMEKDEETGEKSLASQVVMGEVEELSLLKMDLLGLKNLTAIHEVISTIKKTRGINIKYQDIPLGDRATYQMLAKGLTGGVFQLESPNMTKVVVQMMSDADTIPDEQLEELFERLIAAVALYRPGPMDYIDDYLAGMRNPALVHYDCPEEEGILASTYGVLVYQEQLLRLAQDLAGYNLGAADLLRRACGKKKQAAMDAEHSVFIHGNAAAYAAGEVTALIPGCLKNGIDEVVAEEIWSKMVKFANYAFNRSHAACYAWIAQITAYMACHWTVEFYCAMINAFEDVGDKVKGYLAIASKRGIKILPPDINKSLDSCSVEDGCIRIGFRALSNLNKFSKSIVKERKVNGPFSDYQSFYERMGDAGHRPNKKIVESLVFSGSLDCLGLNKNQLKQITALLENDYKKNSSNRELGQFSIFSEAEMKIPAPVVEEYQDAMLMDEEFKAIGFYLTRHPVDSLYAAIEDKAGYKTITDLALQDDSEEQVMTYGLIRGLKQLFTKRDQEMYVFSIEDRFSSVRCVIFPKRVAANKHLLTDGAVVKVIGEFEHDEDRGRQIIIKDLGSSEEVDAPDKTCIAVTVRNKTEQDALLAFIHQNPGHTGVRILAGGQSYPIARKLNLSPSTLDYLKAHFSKVSL